MKKLRKLPRNKLQLSGIKAGLKTRSFRVGGYSVLAFLLVAAIAVAVNLLVNALPASMTQLDTTSNQLFTISEQTEKILHNLETDVTVYWVVQDGQEDDALDTLLNRYASLSTHLTVTKVDPDESPTFVQKYVSLDTLYNNSLIVESEARNTYISYNDIYETDYSNYYTTGSADTSFSGESALTSAIDYVTSDNLPKLYAISGHGESELSTSFQSAVEQENIELETLSLLTLDEIPEDADCLLINSPQSDLSEEETQLLRTYLQGGGNLLLLTSPLEDGSVLTNLEGLMADYGVTAQEGIVVEGDQSNYAFGMPYYLLPSISSHTITSPLKDGNYYVLLPLAQGLQVTREAQENLSITQLLTTSDSAYAKVAGYSITTYDREDGDVDGPFALAVAITDTIDEDTEAHIVWVSSGQLVSDQVNTQVSGGNQDFFLNALGWMCERENSISIHAKSLSTEYLTINSGTASLMTVCIVGIIPLAYLGIGIIIWVRRKRR